MLKHVMIWNVDGVWLQTVDEAGVRRSSYLGRISRESAEFFAVSRGMDFVVHHPEGPRRNGNGPRRDRSGWGS